MILNRCYYKSSDRVMQLMKQAFYLQATTAGLIKKLLFVPKKNLCYIYIKLFFGGQSCTVWTNMFETSQVNTEILNLNKKGHSPYSWIPVLKPLLSFYPSIFLNLHFSQTATMTKLVKLGIKHVSLSLSLSLSLFTPLHTSFLIFSFLLLCVLGEFL